MIKVGHVKHKSLVQLRLNFCFFIKIEMFTLLTRKVATSL